jgi:DNA polymerase-3 subunit alpha
LPFGKLMEDCTGLICLSGGRRGGLARLLANGQEGGAREWLGCLKEIFGDRLYSELQIHEPADATWVIRLAMISQRMKIQLAATHDIHYLREEQAHVQRLLTAIRLIKPMSGLSPEEAAPPRAYFTTTEEMREKFGAYPSALENTQEIAERCPLELPLGAARFPEIPLPPEQTIEDVLRQKAQAGMLRLYGKAGEVAEPVQARLDHELAVINECGYGSLFLIMKEILGFAREQGIPTASRGSASSSLVAHCLGITTPDPIRLNLYFERFLNPARSTPPDIDTDVCSRRRDEVIRFVYRRFGEERTATVGTINRFRRRSALRETAKAHGLPPAQVSALADALPHRWYGPPERTRKDEDPFADLAERYTSPTQRAILRDAAAILGLPHHLSVHPGGVVISPAPLTELLPTQLASKGVTITQFDLDSIERLGLVKIDLLGIRGLSVLGDVGEAIAHDQAGEHTPALVHPSAASTLEALEAIPLEDAATQETVLKGRTIGCFQIESPGMRATLKEIQAKSVDDIMAALALYRPGPLSGGLKDAFVRRHLGLEPVMHLHRALTPLLADTYGVILYQEQVLRIAHELAGLSLADADLLRRAMSHFDPGKQMETLKEKFMAGAFERQRVPAEISEKVWELMAAFAGYGFPKAHAASYAVVGWRLAWCKTHHPALFMAAVLANWGGYYSQRIYLTEARRMGLPLRPPQVNHAQKQFSVQTLGQKPVLFMGLDQVRDLTRRTQENILRERPFRTLIDFLGRVDPRPQEAENLARTGALEDFGSIPFLLSQISSGGWRGGQLSLFSQVSPELPDWRLAEKVAAQEEILGVGVIAHPLELAADQTAASGAISTVEAASRLGQRVRVAGMRQTWRRTPSSRGEAIYFMSLEDLDGALDVVIFGDVYRQYRSAFSTSGPYILEGTVELDKSKGEPFIRAERIEALKS